MFSVGWWFLHYSFVSFTSWPRLLPLLRTRGCLGGPGPGPGSPGGPWSPAQNVWAPALGTPLGKGLRPCQPWPYKQYPGISHLLGGIDEIKKKKKKSLKNVFPPRCFHQSHSSEKRTLWQARYQLFSAFSLKHAFE